MAKYLTGLEIMQSKKDWRWINFYINRGRITPQLNQDAIQRKQLRVLSWRRIL